MNAFCVKIYPKSKCIPKKLRGIVGIGAVERANCTFDGKDRWKIHLLFSSN